MKPPYKLEYQKLVDCLPALVDSNTGIIKSIFQLPRQADSPNIFYYKAIVSNTNIFNSIDNIGTTAGTSLNKERALAKAIGEAVERYCAGSYSYDLFELCTYENLNQLGLSPSSCQLFLNSQLEEEGFPLDEFTKDTMLNWYPAKNMITNQDTLVPASLVYCPYETQSTVGESSIVETISTGLAAHISYEDAALNGLLEVIERHNFMMFWLTRQGHIRIEKESLNSEQKILIVEFERFGYSVEVYFIAGKDEIPTVLAVMKGTRKYNVPLTVAAASHLNTSDALTKCLEELALMERYSKRKMLAPSSLSHKTEPDKIKTLTDHVMTWLNPAILEQVDFLDTAIDSIKLSGLPKYEQRNSSDNLEFVLNQISKTGYQVLMSEITTSDIKQLGLRVVRAIIPGYIPLNKAYNCRPYGSPSLVNYYEKLGVAKEDIYDHVNKTPHPFA